MSVAKEAKERGVTAAGQVHSPVISVVIPSFNRSATILPTLQSVQVQTFEDFECLVVDDGSDDGGSLAAVVESLHDQRFRYIRQDNNGAGSARNKGFDMARGKFVAMLDSDDLFLPDKLEKVVRRVQGSTTDVLVYSQMIVERGIDRKWVRPGRGILPGERVDEYVLCTSGTIRTSTVVLSTSLARSVRFDETLPSLQDTDFAIRVAAAGAEIVFIGEPLVVFNDEPSGNRVSRNGNYKPLLTWLENMRNEGMSERAYWAGRGSQCARIASYSNRVLGIRLYLGAAARGVFPLRQAIVLAAQVTVPYRLYQKVANLVVRFLGTR